ncbi:MAG: DNA polymerase II [Acidobacteriota bacterium]
MADPPAPYRGFILEPTYRIERGRPVVLLFGKLANGEPFLVRDHREAPAFYIEAADAERAAALGASSVASQRVTLAGRPAAKVDLAVPPDAPPLRDRLFGAGIPCYEADVRFAVRYLMRRGIRSAVTLRGPSRLEPGLGRVFEDPEIAPAESVAAGGGVELAVLSFDIETDMGGQELLSVAFEGEDVSEVLLWTPPGMDCPDGAIPFASQKELLQGFRDRLVALDPDVLTGWNIVEFDLPVLARLAEREGVAMDIGRGGGPMRIRPQRSGGNQITLPGRLVLDGIRLLRGAFVKMESYSLDHVARQVLGEGKLLSGAHRGEEIQRLFREDREHFVAYNALDARLVLDILDRLQLVELACERSLLTGLPPDRVSGSIAAFDLLYLSELHRLGIVAPTVATARRQAAQSGTDSAESNYGGAVLEPDTGLWEHVLVFDFKSLYPSLIRTFQIDPLGYYRAAREDDGDPIRAPNGAAFSRRPGILPALLDTLFPRREAAKAAGDKVASFAIKILMNSFYGVLGTSACRFYNPPVANAITGFGRELLMWSKKRIEGYGHRVLYGDTDSLFVASGAADASGARDLGEDLVRRLNEDLADHIGAKWKVESRLELEFERLYLKLLLAPVRHGTGGARKRYAGLVDEGDGPKVIFTGLEAVRRDWTDLARTVQRELYERLFHERPVEDYLHQVVTELRDGQHDGALIYRKALRKRPEEYTATTPPHVAAARKMPGKTPRIIRYVITPGGAEPAAGWRGALDYEHYVQKQIRPIAEPVLAILQLDFAKVIGDDRQLELF